MDNNFQEFKEKICVTNLKPEGYVDWEEVLLVRDNQDTQHKLSKFQFWCESKTIEELNNKIEITFNEQKKLEKLEAFNFLYILVAERIEKKKTLYKNWEEAKTSKEIIEFVKESGLENIFINSVKLLKDYLYGVEVGLDSHRKKNRTSGVQINYLENELKNLYYDYELKVKKESIKNSKQSKKIDFTFKIENNEYWIKTNFFNDDGSKITNMISLIEDISQIAKEHNATLIWVLDGGASIKGKNEFKLEEKWTEYTIMNNYQFVRFLRKLKNKRSYEYT